MNADTQIDLDALHQAITDSIRQAFPSLQTVDEYPDDRRKVAVPAVLVELTELSAAPDDDPGTGQLALEAQFEARYIIGFRGLAQARLIRSNAATLAHHIHRQRWGLPIEPARVTACMPDEFSPELDQYHVWRVEWSQIVHIGANEWIDNGITPSEVYVGVQPYIGPDHVEEYQRIVSEESAE